MPINIDELSFSELKVLGARVEQRKRQLLLQRRDEVRRRLAAEAKQAGYTIAELFPAITAPAQGGAVYANPANLFQTWKGRGKRPRWLVEALAAGRSLDDLRIDR